MDIFSVLFEKLNSIQKLVEKYKFETFDPYSLGMNGWITPDNDFLPRLDTKNHNKILQEYYNDTVSSADGLAKRAAEDGFIRLMGYAVDLPDLSRGNLKRLARFLELVVSPKMLHDEDEYLGTYAILNMANNRIYMDVPFLAIESGDIRSYYDPHGSRILV